MVTQFNIYYSMGNNPHNRQQPASPSVSSYLLLPTFQAHNLTPAANKQAPHSRSAQYIKCHRLGGKHPSRSMEIEICSFRPISHKPCKRLEGETVDSQISRLLKKMSAQTKNTRKLSKRELEEFLKGQARFVRERDKSIENSRNNQRQKQLEHNHPKLSKHALLLAARKRTQGVVRNIQCGSKPILQLRRDRHKSSYQNPPTKADMIMPAPEQQPLPKPYLSTQNSTIQCVIRDFAKAFKSVCCGNKLSYVEMCEVMKRTGFVGVVESVDSRRFIKERGLLNDMWILTAKSQAVDGMSMMAILLALFGADVTEHLTAVQSQFGKERFDKLLSECRNHNTTPKKQSSLNKSLENSHQLFGSTATPPKRHLLTSSSKKRISTSNGQSTKKKIILKKSPEHQDKSVSSQSGHHLPLSTIFQILERSRQSQNAQINFGNRKQRGYLVYHPGEIQQIVTYFQQFAQTKIHNLKNHKNNTSCYATQPVQPKTPNKSLPKTDSKTRDILAQRRKQRIVEAAKRMKIIKQATMPKTRLELMEIQQKLRQKVRKSKQDILEEKQLSELTFQPNTSKAKSPTKQSAKKQFDEPLFSSKKNQTILQIDIYVDDRKYQMQVGQLDNPTDAAHKFLQTNGIDCKWKHKLAQTIKQALIKLNQQPSSNSKY